MTFTLEKEKDKKEKRRYNLPTAKEIAIVWHNNEHRDDPPTNPDFVCYPGRGEIKDLKRLNLTHPLV